MPVDTCQVEIVAHGENRWTVMVDDRRFYAAGWEQLSRLADRFAQAETLIRAEGPF